MPKFHSKSLEKQKEEAINRLPHNDNQSIADVQAYLLMSDELLESLPSTEPDGSFKFYKVGDGYLGKLSLIQFVKSLKNKI